MKALLVVDLQYDFLPGGSLAVKDADQILPVVKLLQEEFEKRKLFVVATQDWHPDGHGSFASANDAEVYSEGILSGMPQTFWPDHCVQGSDGALIHKDFHFEQIVQKGTDAMVDSYSGFFNNARGHDTGLHTLLKDNGVTEVYVCGLATDFCVKYTAMDAKNLGYEVFIIEDAVRGVDLPPGNAAAAIKEMKDLGCIVLSSGEALNTLDD